MANFRRNPSACMLSKPKMVRKTTTNAAAHVNAKQSLSLNELRDPTCPNISPLLQTRIILPSLDPPN